MKKLLIVADYNDADYVKDVISIEDDTFEKFLPLLNAINNFEPYVCRNEFGHICEHNWISSREDLGEKNIYETYPQFSKEYIDEFIEVFTSGLYLPYDDCVCHTIIEISDIVTDEKYVDWKQDIESRKKRRNSKVREYLERRSKIYSYRRSSDGKLLCDIPYKEMDDYENKLLSELHNLWKYYQ